MELAPISKPTEISLLQILSMMSSKYFHCFSFDGVAMSALQLTASKWSIITNLWPLTTHIYHVMIIVTGGFSKKSFFIIIFRSSRTQMFFETSVIRNFAIFIGKHLCWSLFLIKLQALRHLTLFQPSSQKRL